MQVVAVDKRWLDILACPVCKGKLSYDANRQELICRFDRLAFPIRADIPVLIVSEARSLAAEEVVP